jgi:diguanylate cyclase (GGDEF)-like protein
MLIAGGSLGLSTLPGPHVSNGGDLPIAVVSAIAILIGALLLLRPRAVPRWATPLVTGLATVLISLGIVTAGVDDAGIADGEMLYLLVVLYSFYFLSPRQAFAQLALIGVAYGWVLTSDVGVDAALARWLVTLGTLTVAGLLVRALNARVDGLVEELDANARRDPLTGTLNRRGLEERLGIELARSRRIGEPLAVIVSDLDGLKEINDRYGHAAGDEALQLAAEVMAAGLRDVDVLARTGGDEFVIVLPNCDSGGGLDVAEQLGARVRERSQTESWPVTMSMGVACAPPLPLDPESLLGAADSALYRAKSLGRDRASMAGQAEVRRVIGLG